MTRKPLVLALMLGLAPSLIARPSRAQTAAEDAATSMARARFKEGVDFFDKGEFEQARASFLQAYALKKHPAVLLNLAWSCLKSGHVLEAEHYFKQFLSDSKDITDKQRADANDGLNQAHAKLGRIEVVAPAGTEVTVDGDRAGVAPLSEAVVVEAGAHTVKFKGSDGTTDTESVSVLGGEKAVARFAKTPAAAPAPPAAATAPAAEGEPASTNPPPEPPAKPAEAPHPKEEAAAEPAKKGLLSPPVNMAPVYVGGVITLAGIGVAIGMSVSKDQAQNNADQTAQSILTAGGKSCVPPTWVPGKAPNLNTRMGQTLQQQLVDACSSYMSSNDDVNTDATIGNIALGIGIVAAAGTIVYWLVADKGDAPAHSAAAILPTLTPIVGRSMGGLSWTGQFE